MPARRCQRCRTDSPNFPAARQSAHYVQEPVKPIWICIATAGLDAPGVSLELKRPVRAIQNVGILVSLLPGPDPQPLNCLPEVFPVGFGGRQLGLILYGTVAITEPLIGQLGAFPSN